MAQLPSAANVTVIVLELPSAPISTLPSQRSGPGGTRSGSQVLHGALAGITTWNVPSSRLLFDGAATFAPELTDGAVHAREVEAHRCCRRRAVEHHVECGPWVLDGCADWPAGEWRRGADNDERANDERPDEERAQDGHRQRVPPPTPRCRPGLVFHLTTLALGTGC